MKIISTGTADVTYECRGCKRITARTFSYQHFGRGRKTAARYEYTDPATGRVLWDLHDQACDHCKADFRDLSQWAHISWNFRPAAVEALQVNA